jgi:hypothetical protein
VSIWAGYKYKCIVATSWIYLLMYNLWSKRNYVINMWCQPMYSSTLKNLWQAKHEKHNEQEDDGYYLVQHYWYGHSQEKKDQVPTHYVYGIHNGSNLAKSTRQMSTFIFSMKKSFKSVLMLDTKGYVSHDDSWRRINKYLTKLNHASEKSKREAWQRGTRCDGEIASGCLHLRYHASERLGGDIRAFTSP